MKINPKTGKRDYGYENRHFASKPEEKKRRAARNTARRRMIASGRASKGDGKDIDHKDRNALNNSPSNLRVQSRATNRAWNKRSKMNEEKEQWAAMFDSLKKGDKIKLQFKSIMGSSPSSPQTFVAVRKSSSKKYGVTKWHVTPEGKPVAKHPGAKYSLYKRGNNVSMAHGDMGVILSHFSKDGLKESRSRMTFLEFVTAETMGPAIYMKGDMENIKTAIRGRYASLKKEGKNIVARFRSHKDASKAIEVLKSKGIKASKKALGKRLPFTL